MSKKGYLRWRFKRHVFERDGHKCRVCGRTDGPIDAHHITDRHLMPAGGYVRENGIALCAEHHKLAEQYHATGVAAPGWSPANLYRLIGSSHARAIEASKRFRERLVRRGDLPAEDDRG